MGSRSHSKPQSRAQARRADCLAAELDAAELAVRETEHVMDDFDYEDKNGHLQHRAAKCPWCREANARWAYFSLARAPGEELRDNPPPGIDKLPDLTPTVNRLYTKMLEAKRHADADEFARAREHIDAQAAAEYAEIEFNLYYKPWQDRIEYQHAFRNAERHGKVKRREVVDGYVKTGKTVLIDGERVPVVRQVERAQ